MDHGALTDLVLATLTDHLANVANGNPPPVGDGVAPAGGGWKEGQPGHGIFVPYVTLVSGGASPRAMSAGPHIPTWAVGFSLRSTGGSRKQCDWMATKARGAFSELKGQKFGEDEPWKVINLEWMALGAVNRSDATDPPFWSVYDTVTLVVDP